MEFLWAGAGTCGIFNSSWGYITGGTNVSSSTLRHVNGSYVHIYAVKAGIYSWTLSNGSNWEHYERQVNAGEGLVSSNSYYLDGASGIWACLEI